jgi:hypothetical protein
MQGVKAFLLFGEGGGNPFNYARDEPVSAGGTPGFGAASVVGAGANYPTVNDYHIIGDAGNVTPITGIRATVLLVRQKMDTTARVSAAFGLDTSTVGIRLSTHCPYSDNTTYFDFGGQSGANRITAAASPYTGVEWWAFVAGTRGSAFYRNGIQLASQSTAITRQSGAGNNFVINRGASATGDIQQIYFFAIFDAEWTQDMVRYWYNHPWEFMNPVPLRRLVKTAPAVVPTPTYLPETLAGPPLRGAPWFHNIGYPAILTPTVPPPPAIPTPDRLIVPEIRMGPGRGAPWNQVLPVVPIKQEIPPALLPVDPHTTTFTAEITMGPPIRGAPWTKHLFPEIHVPSGNTPNQVNQSPSAPPAYGEFTHGPPIAGAPWCAIMKTLFPEKDWNPPRPPRDLTQPGVKKPFLERVPAPRSDDSTAQAQWRDRMRRHTEKLSDIVNSLIAQNQLVQTGPASWYIAPDAANIQNAAVTIIKTYALFNHHDDFASVHTDGTEDTLYNDVIPANTFVNNGDWLLAEYCVDIIYNATATRRVQMYWDGTTIMDSGVLTYTREGRIGIRVIVVREKSDTVRIKVDSIFTGVVLQPEVRYSRLGTQDFTQTHTLSLTGIATASGAAVGDIVGVMGFGAWNSGV